MNYIVKAQEEAQKLVLAGYEAAAAAGELPQAAFEGIPVEIPKDASNGDYASSFAMQAAKTLRRAPRMIADAVVRHMSLEDSLFSSVDVAGAGFINFHLGHRWFEAVVADIAAEGADYGRSKAAHPEKIMVEFVSANPTGPMHMGNARGGVLGDCIAEVLSRAGNDVWREFLINDAGNQVEKFAQSLEARYIQALRGEESFAFPEDGYHGDDIRELAGDFIDEYGDKYLYVSERERRDALAAFGLKRNIARMKSDLKRYKIEYDRWFCESELHNAGYVKETMELLKKRLANLLSVKSIVTLCLTITFCVLTVQAKVTQEFNTVYLMVIAFYFGTQNGKNAQEET